MPTAADLERLRALSERLLPLSSVQRGELIRAQDWNVLVGALIEVAQAVLAQEENPQVVGHDHADQVTVAWLAPALRSLVERGPLSDPAGVAKLIDLGQQVKRLTTQIDQGATNLAEFRGRLTDVQTRDLQRQAEVTAVRRNLDGITDARDDIQALRETLGAVQRDVRIAAEVATRLTADGQIIDVAGLVTRVGDLEQLRERLRTPTGDLFDARGLELRLTQLTNTFVTQEQLDDALRRRRTEIPPEVLSGIEERVTASVNEELQGRFEGLRTEIRNETTERLSGVDGFVSRAVADALPGVTTSVTEAVRAQIDAARRAAITEATTAAQQALAQREAAIRADIGRQLEDLRGTIGTAVRAELERQLPAQLNPLQREVANLSENLQATTSRLDRQAETLDRHEASLRDLSRSVSAIGPSVRADVLNELDVRASALRQELQQQLAAADAANRQRLESSIADLRRTVLDEATRVAGERASAEARAIRTQILAEVRTIAREEVNVVLRDRVRMAVGEAVHEAVAALPGMVSQEVARATSTLRAVVREEVEALRLPVRSGGGMPR
ncbi:MAG: hypothetical protein AB7P18_22125 [Candidatus Binatia bacterium]